MEANRFNYNSRTLADFRWAMNIYGWAVYENVLSDDFVSRIRYDLQGAYELRRKIQKANGIAENMSGTLHHLVERDNFSLPFLSESFCDEEITDHLGGKYILNGMNAVINTQYGHPYVSNMHRDVRTYNANENALLQMIVTLDDFVFENGATLFLSGSHQHELRPEEVFFEKHASSAIAKQGSIILFDSNIWHAAGENKTSHPRRALTLGFTRPHIKPQFDYSRFLGYDFGENLSDKLRQVIGYNARIPESLHEYYQPVERRMYQRNQG